MPANNGLRLDHRQRIANFRKHPIETNEYHSVDGAGGEFLWSSPPQNVYLLPQRPNLCLKRCSRADPIDGHPTNKPAEIPHGITASPDSLSTANQIRFATRTAFFFSSADALVATTMGTLKNVAMRTPSGSMIVAPRSPASLSVRAHSLVPLRIFDCHCDFAMLCDGFSISLLRPSVVSSASAAPD
jgi:hypothetical protein